MKLIYPQVYSYTLPDFEANKGSQKIGYTEHKDVDKRIREQTETPAMRLKYEKLWSASAFFANSRDDFKDKAFHKFLDKSGIENRRDLGTEWYYFNGTPERSKELFDSFRNSGFAALQTEDGKQPYDLREEQEDAIAKAQQYFESHEKGEFLWNAKPRFGKTLATYDLAERMSAQKVLIVTNRPAIANSWFEDFQAFVRGYYFVSDAASLGKSGALTYGQYHSFGGDKPIITFLSLQDLKGSRYFGGSHEKLQWVADTNWDLLVIDEAHEGIDTDRTDAAFDFVGRQHTLHLSGTPFKALANNKFSDDAIFNWTYLDEQQAKRDELQQDESGPHADLPDLQLYTYRISQMTADAINEGIEIGDETRDYAFDLHEFFATKNQKFVHEDDVRAFLRNLTHNTKYPFSTPELRDELRHTFWYVGNRVESVKALEQLLQEDEVFGNGEYKIIVAAGDGRSFSEEEHDFDKNEKSFDKVKKAIKENPKTITLSCGQLTTGVTIKEWSAVLMLTDIKAPALYMQAAFRAQNPYRFFEDGQLKAKKSAYLFDFAPTRVLEIYDSFANSLNPKAVSGKITEAERQGNIKELLNYFPVISEDVNGKMIELDAEKVLTFPNALAAAEIVKARFMTNMLFNDNIKGVFQFPKEVEAILNKLPVEKNKRPEKAKATLGLDDARKQEQQKQTKINENKAAILGDKIYSTKISRIVDNALDGRAPEEAMGYLSEEMTAVAEPLIAKLKVKYKVTGTEAEELEKAVHEKVKITVADYQNAAIKDPQALKDNLENVLEQDIVAAKVEEQEQKAADKAMKSKIDEVRDHLRAFTRTIPMFIMANSSKQEITIDNFDEEVSDEDFLDLTNITKAEFSKLRDGFTYQEDGETKTFGGVFDRYRFNASIAEFVAEKQARADYFSTDEDIFELIPNQKNNQIFTPRNVVKMMVDGLAAENPELFTRTDSTLIDLYMKSGMYITEVTKRLFENTRKHYASDSECIQHILEKQVYGLAPTAILQGITQSYIFGFDNSHHIRTSNFKQHDLSPQAKHGTAAAKITELFSQGDTMKFDAVVGNPPYQDDAQMQIYTDFYLAAREIGNNVAMIFPTGWQAPKTGNKFKKLNKKEIKEDRQIVYIDNRQNVFHGIAGAEWTNIIMWRRGYDNGLDGLQKILTNGHNAQTVKLLTEKSEVAKPREIKILADMVMGSKDFKPLQALMTDRKPYGLSSDFLNDPAKYGLPYITQAAQANGLRIFGLKSRKQVVEHVPQDYPIPKESKAFQKYKVFVGEAWGNWSEGSGLGGAFADIIIARPGDIATETFTEPGHFDDLDTARKHAKYLMTRFTRALLYANKHSLHSRSAWGAVPVQDYSEPWWHESIDELEARLFDKYRIPDDVRQFVLDNVQRKTEKNIVGYQA